MNVVVIVLIGITFISTISGWLLSRSKKVEKPVKVMLFVFYFWLIAFIQLGIFAVLYQMGFLENFI